jgi:hypothetical protein
MAMAVKKTLDLDQLAVESFETTSASAGARGTVHAHESDDPEPVHIADCTCAASCLCPTNAYYCATVQETAISCDYTYNGSCRYNTSFTCGGYSCNICTD